MNITIATLAKELGISKATISRALRNDSVVHPSTRARVLEAAAHSGYQTRMRQSKKTQKGKARFLLLMPDSTGASPSIAFHTYLKGMVAAAGAAQCALTVEEIPAAHRGNIRRRRFVPNGLRQGADVVFFIQHHSPHDVAEVAEMVPTVSLQWYYPQTRADVVTSCNAQGMAEVTEVAIKQGHRSLAFLEDSYQSSFFSDRHSGFLRACIQAQLPLEGIRRVPFAKITGPDLRALRSQGVTALVANGMRTARVAIEACGLEGLRIPEDMGLGCFDQDGLPLADGHPVNAYDARFEEVGRGAIQVALQRLQEPGASRIIQMREGLLIPGETFIRAF